MIKSLIKLSKLLIIPFQTNIFYKSNLLHEEVHSGVNFKVFEFFQASGQTHQKTAIADKHRSI